MIISFVALVCVHWFGAIAADIYKLVPAGSVTNMMKSKIVDMMMVIISLECTNMSSGNAMQILPKYIFLSRIN